MRLRRSGLLSRKGRAGLLWILALGACLAREKPMARDVTATSFAVEVIRDVHGIPHVYARSETDAALIGGYEMSRDRLFQMDYLRRSAQGRTAEVFGASFRGVDYRTQDELARAIGFYRTSQAAAQYLRERDPDIYEILSAFSAGVNAFLEDAALGRDGARLPFGFGAGELGYVPEPWSPADTLAIGKLAAWLLSGTAEEEALSSLARVALGAEHPEYLRDLLLSEPVEKVFILDGFPTRGMLEKRTENREEPRQASGTSARPPGSRPTLDDALLQRGLAWAHTLKGLPFTIQGSNNWAVSGQLTATGRPILANDPHLSLWSPPIFYLVHYNTAQAGGPLDVAGLTFPGAPGVVLGFNRSIAWGATVARGDVTDLYAVKLSADGRRAVFQEGEEPLQRWSETIRVRKPGGAAPDMDAFEHEIQIVPRYGPLLPGDARLLAPLFGGQALAMRWTGNQPTLEAKAFLGLNRATTPREFHDALLDMSVGAQNFLYADREGNIAFFAHGLYPLRKTLSAENPPWFVLPAESRFDWTGEYLPTAKIPQALNPPSGLIVTANNDPVGTTADNDPLDDEYYLGFRYADGFRAGRILHVLDDLSSEARRPGGAKITLDQMKRLQVDKWSGLAARLLPHLERAMELAQSGSDPALAQYATDPGVLSAYDLLSAWDRVATEDSGAPTVFYAWASSFAALAFRDEMTGLLYDQLASDSTIPFLRALVAYLDGRPTSTGRDYFDSVRTADRVETRHELALEALRRTVTLLRERFGGLHPAEWPWGDYLETHLTNPYGEPLSVGPLRRGGMVDTVDAAAPQIADPANEGGPPRTMRSSAGPVARFVVGFGEDGAPRAEFALAGGQSGDPQSPHFTDLLEDWLRDRYRPFPFARSEVEGAQAERRVYPAGFPRVR